MGWGVVCRNNDNQICLCVHWMLIEGYRTFLTQILVDPRRLFADDEYHLRFEKVCSVQSPGRLHMGVSHVVCMWWQACVQPPVDATVTQVSALSWPGREAQVQSHAKTERPSIPTNIHPIYGVISLPAQCVRGKAAMPWVYPEVI